MLRGNFRRGMTLVRRRTHRGAPTVVRLFERDGCGLCEEAHRSLRRLALERPLEIERLRITDDPALEQRYALRIPVIVVGGAELDAAGVDDAAVARWVREVAP